MIRVLRVLPRLSVAASLPRLSLTSTQVRCLSSSIKIYTRTGDKGKSSLYTGERRSKDDTIFEALGNTDELNSSLGLAREFLIESKSTQQDNSKALEEIEDQLIKIQTLLLDLGSFIATPKTKAQSKQLERLGEFKSEHTRNLEGWIDNYDSQLPVLKNFILPSGGKCASTLHLSRSICRRLERSLQPLYRQDDLDHELVKFVNRLSDFLFVLARFVAHVEGKAETVYKK